MEFRFVQLKKSISFMLAVLLVFTTISTGVYADEIDDNIVSFTEDVSGAEEPVTSDVSGADYEESAAPVSDVSENIDEVEVTAEVFDDTLLDSLRALFAERTRLSVVYPDDCDVYDAPAGDNAVSRLALGTSFYVTDVELRDYSLWYYGYFFEYETEMTGYISEDCLFFTDEEWLSEVEKINEVTAGNGILRAASYDGTEDIEKFPVSYREKLRALKSAHSNWVFVPDNTGLDYDRSVELELGEKSWIQATNFNSQNGFVGAGTGQSGWYYATKAGVSYYMDPRNFLTENYIFMFEQLTFNQSYQTESAIQTFLNSCFMKGQMGDEGMTYARAFYKIGKARGISPVHLASLVRQEQGTNGSVLITGTYPGFEGYYNFFNVGASGHSTEEVIRNGLQYAKDKGWNTRYKSIEGGSQTVGNGYILRGQDTVYYEKFNVGTGAASATYTHQYMQNIQAPSTQAYSTRNSYKNSGCLNSPFVFKIPVFNNMPKEAVDIKVTLSAPTKTIRTADFVTEDTTGLTKNDKAANTSSVQLTLKITHEDYVKAGSLTYKSSDESVATVDSNGLVTAVDAGTCKITATVKDAEFSENYSGSITIKVIKPIMSLYSDEAVITIRRPDTYIEDSSILPEEDRAANITAKSLAITVNPGDTADDTTLTYTTSAKTVAKVNSEGIITPVAVGTATIKASASKASTEYKPSISFTVNIISPVTGITLSNPQGSDVLLAGQSTRLTAAITPKDATGDKAITYESSDESVLRVDEDGTVTAVGEGTAVITAHSYVYSDSISFNVVSPQIKFYDVSGIEVLKEATVEYGEPIEEALFDEADAMYRAASGQSTIYLGMYTLPEGGGAAWSRTSKISEAVTGVYPLYRKMDSEFYVIPPGDYEYTGSTIKPVVHVYANVPVEGGYESRELTLNTDYKVAYANNTKVNTNPKKQPVVTVTGKGNYLGTVKTYFNIVPARLDLASTTAADVTAQYTGKTIKSQPAVYRNGKKLVKDKDYKLSYPSTLQGAYRDAGSWPVLITGIGAYSGKISCNEIITKDILLSKVKITNIRNQSFINDPDGIETTFTIKYGKTELERGVHYTAEYINNHAIGTAQIVLTAIPGSGFRGTRTISFKITGTSIAKVKILDSDGKNGIKSKVYTGNEEDVKQSDYELWLGQDYLIQSTDGVTGDYVVKYTNINKAGTAKITFTGINYYTGSVTKTYKISPRKLAEAWTAPGGISGNELLPETPSHVFVKGGVKPVPEVKDGEKTLVKGTDYTITWANYGTVVTSKTQVKKLPYFIIKGKGSYTGSVKGYYRITDGCLGDEAKVSIKASDMVYSKKAGGVLASPVLKDSDGKTLVKNKDYKITSYTYLEDVSVNDKKGNEILRHSGEPVNRTTDIIPAGTHLRVTVTGMGNYLGTGDTTRETDYRVSVANLSKVTVKVLNKKYYDFGRPVKLTGRDLKVTYGGIELTEGVDYYIDNTTYSKNVNVGKATVTLRPVGDNINFCGSRSVSYTIQKRVISFLSRLKRE